MTRSPEAALPLVHEDPLLLRVDAMATLGAALQRERTEGTIHARLREGLATHGVGCALLRVEVDGVRVVWAALGEALARQFHALAGTPLDGYLGRHSAFSSRVTSDGCVYSEDWPREASSLVPDALASGVRAALDATRMARAIVVRAGAGDGTPVALVIAGERLHKDDVPAAQLLAGQLSVALDAARTIADLSRRNAQLAVLNQVAKLAGEATDLAVFFARASEIVRPVAGYAGCAVFVHESGELVRLHEDEGATKDLTYITARIPATSPIGDVMRDRVARVVSVPFPGGDPELVAVLSTFRSLAWVPLVARSRAVGVLAAGFDADLDTARAAIDLLGAVGAHFAGAIESQRLLSDLRRRVAGLEAVHVLALRVHANAPRDVASLIQDGCRDIAAALSASAAAIFVASEDRSKLRAAAGIGIPQIARESTIDLASDALSAEVMRERVASVSDDITRDPRSAFHGRKDIPPLAILAVPLAWRAEVRGVAYVGDASGRKFSAGDVALANALAGALGVGVENAELYAEARRRVEELSLLNEVGRAVAGSLELGEVLREAAEGARRLVGTGRGYVILYDDARGELRFGAGAGMDDSMLRDLRIPVTPGTVFERILRERRAEAVEDVQRCEVGDTYRRIAGRAFVAVPVLLRGEPRGILVADEERAPRRFSDPDVQRLTAVADRLAVAVENARLYLETRHRAEELGLLHEVGRSLVETLDTEQVLGAGVRNLARIVDAPAAYLLLASKNGERLEVRAVAGGREDGGRGAQLPLHPPDDNLASRVFANREPVVVQDALSAPRIRSGLPFDTAGSAFLALPLVVRDRAIGAVIIVETRGRRLFTPPEVERAAAVANQLAVAADNARLYDDLRTSYAELARAQEQLIQRERLAALGELSAVVAHEVRNPLGVIFNSLGSLRRLVQPKGDARMLFDIVDEEAHRLNRIVGDLLDFARPSMPELRPELLDVVVEDAVSAAVTQQGARIELKHEIDPAMPPVALDARLIRQAVLNIAVNAVQAMPRGGRITIRTRREGDQALLEVEDSGPGIPNEVKARIFEPFFTTKASGTGLGLAVVKRIVEGHGGTVSVRSAPGGGTLFALRFPLSTPSS